MTEAQAIEWMRERLTDSQPEVSALEMILQDIKEYGFESWLDLPVDFVVNMYITLTDDITGTMMSDFRLMLNQEAELDELGIGQTMRIDAGDALSAFRSGVLDIMKSLLCYITTQNNIKSMVNED